MSLRSASLDYIHSLRIAPAHYRMTRALDGSLFTDCFALFARHLLDDEYDKDERAELVERLQAAQNPDTGGWQAGAAGSSSYHTPDHVSQQLTGFALSALATLGAPPRYPLRFLDAFADEAAVADYLSRLPWDDNPWHSGNRAMFLGTFLVFDAQRFGYGGSSGRLEAWFDWHDRHARPGSGFWGARPSADWYVGMGGASHQYVIYHFCGRRPPYLERAVERTLRMQYRDGRFWPVVGGGSCYELDAVEILLVGHALLPEWRPQIEAACRRAIPVVLASQNDDGGFCWARRRWLDLPDTIQNLLVTGDARAMLWSLRARLNAYVLRHRERRTTQWTNGDHPVSASSLFDTWFRLLTLAQIARITGDPRLAAVPWRSLPAPNWGFLGHDQ